jgi:hypothetical protein
MTKSPANSGVLRRMRHTSLPSIKLSSLQHLKGYAAAIGFFHVHAAALEQCHCQLAIDSVIVDNQNFFHSLAYLFTYS